MDLNHPSITVALPIVIAMMVAVFASIRTFSKSMDFLGKRIDDLRAGITARLTVIERRLDKLDVKVEAL